MRDYATHCAAMSQRAKAQAWELAQGIIGERFGMLVAVEIMEPAPGKRGFKVRCACDCGGEIRAGAWFLRNGHVGSCGCRGKDLTGRVFGLLAVLSRGEIDKHQKQQWVCRCECGGETTVETARLLNGKAMSCGCRVGAAAKERWAEYRGPAFWARVQKGDPDACWPWAKPPQRDGYCATHWEGRVRRAHQIAFLLTNGPIPEGKVVRHTCDNRICCNPAHLVLGTHAENMADMVARGGRKGIGAGPKNGRAKLSFEQAAEIRAIYAAQLGKPGDEGRLSQLAIGKMYGISQFAVSMIVAGNRYVEGEGRPSARVDPRTLRRRVFERDGGRCAMCGVITKGWQADHVVEWVAGGTDELENLQTLCRVHHAAKAAA